MEEHAQSAAQLRESRKAMLLAMRARDRSRIRRIGRWSLAPLKALNSEFISFRYARQRKAFLDQYLGGSGFKGLHIGCGPNYKKGWINTDVIYSRLPWTKASPNEKVQDFPLDLIEPLPLPNNSLDVVYGEHVIEHVNKDDARSFFREAFRVLRPGGVLRLATPDLDGTCRVFLGLDPEVVAEAFEPYWFEDEWSPEFWINATFRYWGHLYLWNFATMQSELQQAGFSGVSRVETGKTASDFRQLNNVECRQPVEDSAFLRFMDATTLIVEAHANK